MANPICLLPPPSEEQQLSIDTFKQGCNIAVQAVAGAGKTTLMLQLCMSDPSKIVQMVTYNACLKLEGRLKIEQLQLGCRVKIDTFHSLAGSAYLNKGDVFNDETFENLLALLDSDQAPQIKKWYRSVDVLMVDEAQDISPSLWKFLLYLIRDMTGGNRPMPQIIVVGDARQMIYEFRKSDSRYLTLAPLIFPGASRRWVTAVLRRSYRLTPATAAFVNTVMVGQDLIVGGNTDSPSLPVVYWPVKDDDIASLIEEVQRRVAAKYTVALLTFSTKNSRLAQLMVKQMGGSAFFVASDGATGRISASSTMLRNKIHVLTYHGTKGLEFDYVYQLSETTPWNQNDKLSCGNVEYVATTRAKRQLIVVEYRQEFFMKSSYPRLLETQSQWHPDFVVARGLPVRGRDRARKATHKAYCASTITDYMAVMVLVALRNFYVSVSTVRVPGVCIEYDTERSFSFTGVGSGSDCIVPVPVIANVSITENVAFLYGMVVPMIVELRRTGSITLLETTDGDGGVKIKKDSPLNAEINTRNACWDTLKTGWRTMSCVDVNASLFYLANFRASVTYVHLLRQISDYDWIDHDAVAHGVACLEEELGESCGLFEQGLTGEGVLGCADYIVYSPIAGAAVCHGEMVERGVGLPPLVYEFKFKALLGVEDVLQTALYVAMLSLRTSVGCCGRLFNIRTGELQEVRVSTPAAFLDAFIAAKRDSEAPPIDDAGFIASALAPSGFCSHSTNTEAMDVFSDGDVDVDEECDVRDDGDVDVDEECDVRDDGLDQIVRDCALPVFVFVA